MLDHSEFQAASGYAPDNSAAPGSVNPPVIFIAPSQLSVGNGEIWIGVSNSDAIYGGSLVYLSTDGSNYYRIGKITGNAVQGVLSAGLTAASGLDTSHTLSLDLSMSGGELESVSDAMCDAYDSLCYVGGELLSYRDATATDVDAYDLSHLRRGLYGTTAGASSGDDFLLIDDAVFRFRLNPLWVGTAIYFKFCAFSGSGGARQSLDEADAYSFYVSGHGGQKALLSDITSTFDASAITSGTIAIERLPAGALERIIKVADATARRALTTADVQKGDTVQQLDDSSLWIVYDDANLSSDSGYVEYTSGVATSMAWSGLTSVPDNVTALAGLTGAADKISYYTGLGAMALASLTSFGRSLIGAANAAAAKALLSISASDVSGLGTAATTASTAYATAAQGTKADSALQSLDETVVTVSISSNAIILDLSQGTFFKVSLTANITSITISNLPASGKSRPVAIEFTQDATGGRTVAGWPASVKWPGGTAPTITATANAVHSLAGYATSTTVRLGSAHADSK